MLQCSVKKRGGRNTLCVSGSLTVRYISEFRERLLKLCDQDRDIVLNVQDVTEVDLSGLQVLCSAGKSLKEQGRKMIIDSGCPDVLLKTVEDAGYMYNEFFQCQKKGGKNNA